MASGRPDWYSSVAMHGRFAEVGEVDKYITVGVDASGNMIAVMTGSEVGVPIKVDANGIILSRMKGAASGDLILKILDDCGDTSTITDWVETFDGLDPSDNQVYVKQGSHSMALGVDADLSAEDRAVWTNSEDQGDLSNYQHDWLYLWVYITTLDYIRAVGVAFRFIVGSDSSNYHRFDYEKDDLSLGWNLLKFDLDNPASVVGDTVWSAIAYMLVRFDMLGANTNDFTWYFNCLMFVRPTPGAGTLKDVAVDENGVMLSKMTGQYADILKPIAIDQDGLMLAVMKGDFAGALKTIAVDTDGRMEVNLLAQGLGFLRTIIDYDGTQVNGWADAENATVQAKQVTSGKTLYVTSITLTTSNKASNIFEAVVLISDPAHTPVWTITAITTPGGDGRCVPMPFPTPFRVPSEYRIKVSSDLKDGHAYLALTGYEVTD